MEKLKTLKDMKEESGKEIMSGSCHDATKRAFDKVKQEAIKLVKNNHRDYGLIDMFIEDMEKEGYDYSSISQSQSFHIYFGNWLLQKFCNITEKDLNADKEEYIEANEFDRNKFSVRNGYEKLYIKKKNAKANKKEVVGIVDNLNNERVATLIKCKQVDKDELKIRKLMKDGKKRYMSDVSEKLDIHPRKVREVFLKLDKEDFWVDNHEPKGCGEWIEKDAERCGNQVDCDEWYLCPNCKQGDNHAPNKKEVKNEN